MDSRLRHMIASGLLFIMGGSFSIHADLLQEGRKAFLDYDFGLASEHYAKYAQQLKKKPNPKGEAELRQFERQLETAENALENVQKIEIIDRMDIPAEGFFKAVRLPANGGRMTSADAIPFKDGRAASDFAFCDESGDFMMWTAKDEEGVSRLVESSRLTDGSWENPIYESDVLNEGGNVHNPFMLADGTTLYFAGDGEGSMGGYDIFVATKDPSTGEYRQPLNLGFPFNSPYDEYFLAIDEENGIGWWATDRNQLDGKVTIYVYRVPETRSNYDPDDEDIDIISLARIDDITETQDPDMDYDAIRHTIALLGKEARKSTAPDFILTMPGGKTYSALSDFHSSVAKRLMTQYIDAEKEQNRDLADLAEYRRKYHASSRNGGASTAIGNQIKDLEKKTEKQSAQLRTMRNSIITAELKK